MKPEAKQDSSIRVNELVNSIYKMLTDWDTTACNLSDEEVNEALMYILLKEHAGRDASDKEYHARAERVASIVNAFLHAPEPVVQQKNDAYQSGRAAKDDPAFR